MCRAKLWRAQTVISEESNAGGLFREIFYRSSDNVQYCQTKRDNWLNSRFSDYRFQTSQWTSLTPTRLRSRRHRHRRGFRRLRDANLAGHSRPSSSPSAKAIRCSDCTPVPREHDQVSRALALLEEAAGEFLCGRGRFANCPSRQTGGKTDLRCWSDSCDFAVRRAEEGNIRGGGLSRGKRDMKGANPSTISRGIKRATQKILTSRLNIRPLPMSRRSKLIPPRGVFAS
jgi:hypothetical protein